MVILMQTVHSIQMELNTLMLVMLKIGKSSGNNNLAATGSLFGQISYQIL